jgi:ubiquinone/menaquinone biosynthesis C-methylase UbiE
MQSDFKDVFGNAKSYESFVGRWSRLVAEKFIDWLEIPSGQAWLDVGAGTGILSQLILQKASPIKVLGIDSSEQLIEFARQQIQEERLEFRIGDALNLPIEEPQFDVAVAGLVLNFLSSPPQAVKSMSQAIKNGGTVAAYVWDYSGQMEMMRHFWNAAIAVDPAASEMDSGQRFTICEPNNLRALFESADLKAVELIPIDVQTRFKNFDDYWLPFLGAQGSVSKYLGGINDESRNAIREQLQKQLPINNDGEIPLVARAWAVKGRKEL